MVCWVDLLESPLWSDSNKELTLHTYPYPSAFGLRYILSVGMPVWEHLRTCRNKVSSIVLGCLTGEGMYHITNIRLFTFNTSQWSNSPKSQSNLISVCSGIYVNPILYKYILVAYFVLNPFTRYVYGPIKWTFANSIDQIRPRSTLFALSTGTSVINYNTKNKIRHPFY